MTPKDREELRGALHQRAREILESGRRMLHEAADAPAERAEVDDSMDAALLDTIATTRLDHSERDAELLHRVGDAVERLRDGSYGSCVDCDRPIELARLRAVPWAERCAEDQSRYETEHRLETPTL